MNHIILNSLSLSLKSKFKSSHHMITINGIKWHEALRIRRIQWTRFCYRVYDGAVEGGSWAHLWKVKLRGGRVCRERESELNMSTTIAITEGLDRYI